MREHAKNRLKDIFETPVPDDLEEPQFEGDPNDKNMENGVPDKERLERTKRENDKKPPSLKIVN